MPTPIKKTLCDVRKQIRTGQSLKGHKLTPGQIEKLQAKERKLVEQQEFHDEQMTHTTGEADPVLCSPDSQVFGFLAIDIYDVRGAH